MNIKLFGMKGSRDAHEIRDFLKRSTVAFAYCEVTENDSADTHIPARFRHHDLPVCIMSDGEVLKRPNLQQIAERLDRITKPKYAE